MLHAALPAGARVRETPACRCGRVAAYYAPQGDFSLSGRFVKPPAELAVTANVLLIVEDGGLHAHGGWAMLPDVEKRFSFDFALPAGWQIAAVTAARRASRWPSSVTALPARPARVRVRLPQGNPAGAGVSRLFPRRADAAGLAGRLEDAERLKFPVFSVLGATHDEGALVVAARDDLTVRPEKIERLVPLDETEMGKYGLAGIVPSLAYRYENPPYAAALVVAADRAAADRPDGLLLPRYSRGARWPTTSWPTTSRRPARGGWRWSCPATPPRP